MYSINKELFCQVLITHILNPYIFIFSPQESNGPHGHARQGTPGTVWSQSRCRPSSNTVIKSQNHEVLFCFFRFDLCFTNSARSPFHVHQPVSLNLVHGLFLKGGRGERAREGANVYPRLVPFTCSLGSHYRSERNASIWVLCQSLENCILFFRWKRTSAGVMLDGGKKVLEFVAIQRRDNSQWAIPGVSTESFL